MSKLSLSQRHSQPRDIALERSGLLMAVRSPTAISELEDDTVGTSTTGILTAAEIARLDL